MGKSIQQQGSTLRLCRRTAAWRMIFNAFSVQRSRRALSRLEDHHLQDLGLTPQEAAEEAARPLWDVPPSWRR